MNRRYSLAAVKELYMASRSYKPGDELNDDNYPGDPDLCDRDLKIFGYTWDR